MSDEANIPWRCFYCGEVFTEEAEARTHFGVVESLGPGCVDKMRTDEKLRLSIVRKLESEIRRLMREAEELDHKAGAYVGMQTELARYFGTCGGAPVKTVSQAWLVHEAMIGRAEAGEARADKYEKLAARYKAAFLRWVGFLKDWRARAHRWEEVAAQGELQLRELPQLRAENATLRASLAEARERVEALEKAVNTALAYGIPPSVRDACAMDRYDTARFKAMEEVKSFLRPALSRPSPQPPTPQSEKFQRLKNGMCQTCGEAGCYCACPVNPRPARDGGGK